MTVNAALSAATLGHLVGLGVREFVVCAGARNVPLVASLLGEAEAKELIVRHHFDERTAAFFALGLTKAHGRPVAVMTTSGTAVAELLPAVIEAHYTGQPIILVTADRPARYRGSGAPQAIEQAGIFGSYALGIDVEKETDLSHIVRWKEIGPLHLNVCLEEPRTEDRALGWVGIDFPPVALAAPESTDGLVGFLAMAKNLLVILGDLPRDWRMPVRDLLLRLGARVWMEATSGLREDESLQRLRVDSEKDIAAHSVESVLRIGGVPSLRFWRDLEDRERIDVFAISSRHFSGLARESRLLTVAEFPNLVSLLDDRPDLATKQEEWMGDSTLLNECIEAQPKSEPAMVRALSEHIPSEAFVFLGNSLPIREWNLAASKEIAHPHCAANRGANGIDGEVATFLGMSEGCSEAWGIFGDLTALYDSNALALLPQLSPGRRRIVVINNGGGRIFSRLSSMARMPQEEKQITENRHDRRFAAWAEMWDVDHCVWRAGEAFPAVEADTVVIEVLPDGASTESFWEAWK